MKLLVIRKLRTLRLVTCEFRVPCLCEHAACRRIVSCQDVHFTQDAQNVRRSPFFRSPHNECFQTFRKVVAVCLAAEDVDELSAVFRLAEDIHLDAGMESAGARQRRIEHFRTVRGTDYEDVAVLKPVQQREERVDDRGLRGV